MKRQVNVVAPLMTNFDTVDKAIKTSEQSSNSALIENQKYLDSIAGRTETLKRTTQEFWNEAISSTGVKYFIQMAQNVLDLANAFGPLKTAAAAAFVVLAGFKKINPAFAFKGLTEQLKTLSTAPQMVKNITSTIGGVGANQQLNAQQVTAYANALRGLPALKQAQIMANNSLSTSNIQLVMSENQVSEAEQREAIVRTQSINQKRQQVSANTEVIISKELLEETTLSQAAADFLAQHSGQQLTTSMLDEAVTSGALTAELREEIVATMALSEANTAAGSSLKGLGNAFTLAFATNPLGVIMAITGVVMALVPIFQSLHKSTDELISDAQQVSNAYNQASSEIDQNISTVTDVQDEFNKLSKGVDDLGNNISLSTDDYARYQEIVQTIVGISPQLIQGYNAEGQAIADKNRLIERSIELLELQQQKEAAAHFANGDHDTVMKAAEAEYKDKAKQAKEVETKDVNKFATQFAKVAHNYATDGSNASNLQGFYEAMMAATGVKSVNAVRSYGGSNQGADTFGNYTNLATNYYDQIVADLRDSQSKLRQYLTQDQAQELLDLASDYDTNVKSFSDQLEEINNTYNQELEIALKRTDDYWKLDDSTRQHVLSYALNLDVNADNYESAEREMKQLTAFAVENQDALSKVFERGDEAMSTVNKDGVSRTYKEWTEGINDFKRQLQFTPEDAETLGNLEQQIREQFTDVSPTIDVAVRPVIDSKTMQDMGWDTEDGDISTFYTTTLNASDLGLDTSQGEYYVNVTPITPDGDVIEADVFEDYLREQIGDKDIQGLIDSGMYLGSYDTIPQAEKAAQALHEQSAAIEEFKAEIANNGMFDEEQQNWISKMLGLDSENGTQSIVDKQIDHVKGLLKGSQKDIDKFIDGLSMEDLELTMSISATDGAHTMSISDLMEQLQATKKDLGIGIQTISTYTTIKDGIDKYNAAINETKEIMGNGTKVTQDYKDSLTALGISQEDLNDCFYEGNELVVKNAKKLDTLVKATKDNISSNLKLARSQAGLKYYDLVKQMGSAISGKKSLDSATLASVNSMMKEADSVRQAILQYVRLEDELNSVSNAFTNFANAKEIDALNTKPDTFLEAVNLMQQTITKTGEFGTESFWAAVDMTIPPSVYQGLTSDTEKIESIISYFKSNVTKDLSISSDDFTIDFDTIEKFFNEMNSKGLLESGSTLGDWKFATEQNLESISKAMGITTDQAQAMFDAMDKYNINREALPISLQYDDSIEGKLLQTTSTLDELQRQKVALLSEDNGGYETNKDAIQSINKEINATRQSMSQWTNKNLEHIHSYAQLDGVIAKLEEVQNLNQKISQADYDNLGLSKFGISFDDAQLMTVQEVMDRLMAKKQELGTPTKLQAQFAIDEIDSQIAQIEAKIQAAKDVTINGEVDANTAELDGELARLKAEKVNIATEFDIELPEDEVNAITQDMNRIQSFKIRDKTFNVSASANSAWSTLRSIANYTIAPKTVTVTTVNKSEFIGPTKPSKVNGTAHAQGTAFAHGNWGTKKTENALVGEVGNEIIVDPSTSNWYTVGDYGPEFVKIPRGAIVFNHKQTEDLLSHGYTIGRGRAFAQGTAYGAGSNGFYRPTGGGSGGGGGSSSSGSNSSSNNSGGGNNSSAQDAANDFKEVFDWFEVKLEEINELLEYWGAQLENIVGMTGKASKIDSIIKENRYKLDILAQGFKLYEDYTEQLLVDIPAQYREAAKDGKIAIETFAGDAGEKTLEAIKNYREWAKKAADVKQQMEELAETIAELAKQRFDVIDTEFDNKISLLTNQIERLKDAVDLTKNQGYVASAQYYQEMSKLASNHLDELNAEHKALQESLDISVRAGDIQKYSDRWYEMVNAIYDVDHAIMDCTSELEDFQNAINDIYWDNFENLIGQFKYLDDETNNLINLMQESNDVINDLSKTSKEYWYANDVTWTDEGVTALGLYNQQMETARYNSNQYVKAINDLNADYKKGKYSINEYNKKLNELKNSQYESIQQYYEARKGIVDLNKTRVDSIKEGIELEVKAYEKLIKKRKEALDIEKDAYSWQKTVKEKQKDIDDIERKISALSNDMSSSAVAQRKKLESDLAEARAELDDEYYNRSIDNQKDALDKELDNFKEQKDKEKEVWEKFLKDTERVIDESVTTVKYGGLFELEEMQRQMRERFSDVSPTIDVAVRPVIDSKTMQKLGYEFNDDDYATFFTQTFNASDLGLDTSAGEYYVNITPILPNGDVIEADSLQEYLQQIIHDHGKEGLIGSGMYLGSFNSIDAAEANAIALHEQSEKIISAQQDSMTANTTRIYDTLIKKASDYNLVLSDSILTPWEDSINAISDYQNTFEITSSATYDELGKIKQQWQDIVDLINDAAQVNITNLRADNESHINGSVTKISDIIAKAETANDGSHNATSDSNGGSVAIGNAVTVKKTATNFATGQRMASFVPGGNYTVYDVDGDWVLIGQNGVHTGWVYKHDLEGYAKGTTGVPKSQLALIDELGEELVLHAGQGGKLQFLSKGTSVIPADITQNLMQLGSINPQEILDRNRPSTAPTTGIGNNNMVVNINYGDVMHIDNFDGTDLDAVSRLVTERFNEHTKQLNNSLKKYTR